MKIGCGKEVTYTPKNCAPGSVAGSLGVFCGQKHPFLTPDPHWIVLCDDCVNLLKATFKTIERRASQITEALKP
jgi:hypothetical protein